MRGRLLWQLSYASAARYFCQALIMVRGLALAHLLGPAVFGVWSSMRLVLVFGDYAHGGSRSGMLQLSTLSDGAGDSDAATRLRRAGSALNLAGSLALVICLIVAVQLLWPDDKTGKRLWLGLGALLLAKNVYVYYRVFLRSRQQYGAAVSLMVFTATLSALLGLAGAVAFGLAGFLAGMGGTYLIASVLGSTFGERYPRPLFSGRDAGALVGTGFPIMASSLLRILLWNVDKLLLWILAGSVALGTYAAQAYISNALMLLPSAVSEVLYPHLVSIVGRTRSPAAVLPYLRIGTLLLAGITAPAVAVACLAIHFPFRWWLPDYTAAIAPGTVLVLAAFFPVVATVSDWVLVSLGGQRRLMTSSALAVTVSVVAVGGALLAGGGLVAVALGAGAGLLVRSVLTIGSALGWAGAIGASALRLGAQLALIFCSVLVVVVLGFMIPDSSVSWQTDLARTVLRAALALALLAPWSMIALRRMAKHVGSSSPVESDEPKDVDPVDYS